MQGMCRLSNIKCPCLINGLVSIYLTELLVGLNELTYTDAPYVNKTQL